MRWTPVALIDPQLGLSRNERRAVKGAAWKRWMRRPWNRAFYIGSISGAIWLWMILKDVGGPAWGATAWWYELVWFGVYVVAFALAYGVMHRLGFGAVSMRS